MPVDSDQLAAEFKQRGYKWKISGELVNPTPEDIEQTLDSMVKSLYDEPVPSQIHVGRLAVMKLGQDKFEVYLQIGEIT